MPKLYFSTPWLSIGFFFALTLLVNQAHARVGSSPLSWTEQHIPKQRRSLKELSNQVFQELLEVHRSSGMMGPVLIPSTAVRVHRILVEGSADQGQEFDEEAQKRALLALRLGADNLIKDLKEEDADYRRFLEQDSNLRAGHMDHRALTSGTLGLILFGTLVVTLIVLAVTNIIAGATGTNIVSYCLDSISCF